MNLSEVVKALQCNSTSTLTAPLRHGCWCRLWFGLHADSEHVDVMNQQITMQVIPSKHLILFHQIQVHKRGASRALLQAVMTNTTVRNLILRVDFLEEPHLTATVHAFEDIHALRFLKICAWKENKCSEDAIRMAFEKIMEKNMSLRKIQVQDGDAQKWTSCHSAGILLRFLLPVTTEANAGSQSSATTSGHRLLTPEEEWSAKAGSAT